MRYGKNLMSRPVRVLFLCEKEVYMSDNKRRRSRHPYRIYSCSIGEILKSKACTGDNDAKQTLKTFNKLKNSERRSYAGN